jgi:hypothetical protein
MVGQPQNTLSGLTFGVLTPIKRDPLDSQQLICKCVCGSTKRYRISSLHSGAIVSCGCRSKPDLVGATFGQLKVVAEAGAVFASNSDKRIYNWKCQCICGTSVIASTYALQSGQRFTCGTPHEQPKPKIVEVALIGDDMTVVDTPRNVKTTEEIVQLLTPSESFVAAQAAQENDIEPDITPYPDTVQTSVFTCDSTDDDIEDTPEEPTDLPSLQVVLQAVKAAIADEPTTIENINNTLLTAVGAIAVGQVFNRLTVVRKATKEENKRSGYWMCKCECGNDTIVSSTKLRNNYTKSCGCLASELTSERSRSHGLSSHPLYDILRMLKRRCYEQNYKSYKHYGAKGVKVCDEWLGKDGLSRMVEWAEHTLPAEYRWRQGYEIERIDDAGNFEPDNCRFIPAIPREANLLHYKGRSEGQHELHI